MGIERVDAVARSIHERAAVREMNEEVHSAWIDAVNRTLGARELFYHDATFAMTHCDGGATLDPPTSAHALAVDCIAWPAFFPRIGELVDGFPLIEERPVMTDVAGCYTLARVGVLHYGAVLQTWGDGLPVLHSSPARVFDVRVDATFERFASILVDEFTRIVMMWRIHSHRVTMRAFEP